MNILRNFYRGEFSCLQRNIIKLNNVGELKKVYGWTDDPVMGAKELMTFGTALGLRRQVREGRWKKKVIPFIWADSASERIATVFWFLLGEGTSETLRENHTR